MSTSMHSAGGDDLARQRRKREARWLDQHVAEFPTMTIADVVADVLATTQENGDLDVRTYLAVQGYRWATIDGVLAYLRHHDAPDAPRLLR